MGDAPTDMKSPVLATQRQLGGNEPLLLTGCLGSNGPICPEHVVQTGHLRINIQCHKDKVELQDGQLAAIKRL